MYDKKAYQGVCFCKSNGHYFLISSVSLVKSLFIQNADGSLPGFPMGLGLGWNARGPPFQFPECDSMYFQPILWAMVQEVQKPFSFVSGFVWY